MLKSSILKPWVRKIAHTVHNKLYFMQFDKDLGPTHYAKCRFFPIFTYSNFNAITKYNKKLEKLTYNCFGNSSQMVILETMEYLIVMKVYIIYRYTV